MTDDGSTTREPAAEVSEQARPRSRRGLLGASVDLALAGIGAVGLLSDEAQAFYQRSIERGQDDVRKVRERLKLPRIRGLGPAGSVARSRRDRAADPLRSSDEWRAVLVRLNMPTATDVHVLTKQVAELEAKIELLRQHG